MLNTECKLKIIYGDVTLGVQGTGFHYIFSYQSGGPESFVNGGIEWLYRTPLPTFWRALTDNDRGSGFHLKSGMWLLADMFMTCTDISVFVDGLQIKTPTAPENNKYSQDEYAKEIMITFRYETATNPKVKVDVSYKVDINGGIQVSVFYHGRKGLPELPVLGLRFVMPTKADGYTYKGLSGETYPDRMAGARKGIYSVSGLPVTPYLIPQDCGVHMDTEWVEIERNSTLDNRRKEDVHGVMRVSCTREKFAFSCLPYTAEEIENATHQEELPEARRTVLCILGAVRGIGGIDSWGSDVLPEYHINAEKEIVFSFKLF